MPSPVEEAESLSKLLGRIYPSELRAMMEKIRNTGVEQGKGSLEFLGLEKFGADAPKATPKSVLADIVSDLLSGITADPEGIRSEDIDRFRKKGLLEDLGDYLNKEIKSGDILYNLPYTKFFRKGGKLAKRFPTAEDKRLGLSPPGTTVGSKKARKGQRQIVYHGSKVPGFKAGTELKEGRSAEVLFKGSSLTRDVAVTAKPEFSLPSGVTDAISLIANLASTKILRMNADTMNQVINLSPSTYASKRLLAPLEGSGKILSKPQSYFTEVELFALENVGEAGKNFQLRASLLPADLQGKLLERAEQIVGGIEKSEKTTEAILEHIDQVVFGQPEFLTENNMATGSPSNIVKALKAPLGTGSQAYRAQAWNATHRHGGSIGRLLKDLKKRSTSREFVYSPKFSGELSDLASMQSQVAHLWKTQRQMGDTIANLSRGLRPTPKMMKEHNDTYREYVQAREEFYTKVEGLEVPLSDEFAYLKHMRYEIAERRLALSQMGQDKQSFPDFPGQQNFVPSKQLEYAAHKLKLPLAVEKMMAKEAANTWQNTGSSKAGFKQLLEGLDPGIIDAAVESAESPGISWNPETTALHVVDAMKEKGAKYLESKKRLKQIKGLPVHKVFEMLKLIYPSESP